MEVKIVNKSQNDLPAYETPESAGLDLRADFSRGINNSFFYKAGFDNQKHVVSIYPGGRVLIPTGLFTAIPAGYEFQIRPRSGTALKKGVTVLNSPGTIDSDYRNEWGVILINLSDEIFEVNHGDRIAQAVLKKVERVGWNVVETLDETERLGGFGHTGVK